MPRAEMDFGFGRCSPQRQQLTLGLGLRHDATPAAV